MDEQGPFIDDLLKMDTILLAFHSNVRLPEA